MGQIRLILHVLDSRAPFAGRFIAYVQCFDHQQCNGCDIDATSGLISLKQAFRSDGTRVGDFVGLD